MTVSGANLDPEGQVYLGGSPLLGATFVTSSIVLAPRLGAAVLIATVVAGQMVGSLFVDHYGAVGYPQHAVSVSRVVGVALIVAGVALIQYR